MRIFPLNIGKTKPGTDEKNRSSEQGFSLLEILVVLAILSLLLSVVSVRMFGVIDSTRFFQTAETTVSDIVKIRGQAIENRTAYIISFDSGAPDLPLGNSPVKMATISLEPEWTAKGEDILVSETGYCSGGSLTLTGPNGRKVTYIISPPHCSAVRQAVQ